MARRETAQTMTIGNVSKEFDLAVSWLEKLIGSLGADNRVILARDLIREQAVHFEKFNGKDMHDEIETARILEAQVEASTWADIYKKFEGRTDSHFLTKLRESTFGPELTHNEISGMGRSGSFGRDIQSELAIASRFGDPKAISFDSGDIIYDLGKFKFSVECKRIHSLKKIFAHFNSAAAQIENNAKVDFGIVALRIDKHIYRGSSSNGIGIEQRGKRYIGASGGNEAYEVAGRQTGLFVDAYNKDFIQQVLNLRRRKVAGFCAFLIMPAVTGPPFAVNTVRHAVFQLWTDSDPHKSEALKLFQSQLDL